MGEMIGKNPEGNIKGKYLSEEEQIADAAGEGMGVYWDLQRELTYGATGEFRSRGLLIASDLEGTRDHSYPEEIERNDIKPGISPDSNTTIGSQNRLPLSEPFGNLPEDH